MGEGGAHILEKITSRYEGKKAYDEQSLIKIAPKGWKLHFVTR